MQIQDEEDIEFTYTNGEQTYVISPTGELKEGSEVYSVTREKDRRYIGNLSVSLKDDALDVVSRWVQTQIV